jgi:DnaK suppressor protein
LFIMTSEERDLLRRELIERLTAIYRTVRAEIDEETIGDALEVDPTDESDQGVDDELWSIAADLDGRDRKLAHSIEDALRRMRHDDYGVCVDCGREIPFERLRLVPWTDRCVDDEERTEGTTTHPTL